VREGEKECRKGRKIVKRQHKGQRAWESEEVLEGGRERGRGNEG